MSGRFVVKKRRWQSCQVPDSRQQASQPVCVWMKGSDGQNKGVMTAQHSGNYNSPGLTPPLWRGSILIPLQRVGSKSDPPYFYRLRTRGKLILSKSRLTGWALAGPPRPSLGGRGFPDLQANVSSPWPAGDSMRVKRSRPFIDRIIIPPTLSPPPSFTSLKISQTMRKMLCCWEEEMCVCLTKNCSFQRIITEKSRFWCVFLTFKSLL